MKIQLSCRSTQAQGRPVIVLSIDVDCHFGSHNYYFNVLGWILPGNHFLWPYIHLILALQQCLHDGSVQLEGQ